MKLATIGIVFGVFMLTGCAEPSTGPSFRPERPEQTQKITKRSPGTQRDSIHVVAVDYKNEK